MRRLLVLVFALLASCDPREVELAPQLLPGRNHGDKELMAAFEDAPEGSISSELTLVYPSKGTVVPSDLTRMRYQWTAPADVDAFELSIATGSTPVRYYTRERDWLDDEELLRFFAPSSAGGSLRVRVRALSLAAPQTVYRSEVVEIRVAATSFPGDVLYWSSTAGGIKRGSFAVDRARLEPGLSGADGCVGCHALSRDGTRLAVASEDDRLELFEGPDWKAKTWPEPMMPAAPMMPGTQKGPMAMPAMMPAAPMPKRGPMDYGWGSFSPDGTQLVFAAKGKLRVIGSETGLDVPKFRLPPETSVSHPDWSPDGLAIAVSYAMGKAAKSNKLVRGSAIARLRIQPDGMFGEPETVVPSNSPDDTLTFPAYSPDGRWLAFSHANGGSKDNPRAQIWIVAADGSSLPVLLEAANRPADADATPDVANNMPTWAPISNGVGFLAFSSTRDYGNVLVGAQRDQLWVTAIDFAALEMGRDPSFPAFWLPFQDPAESNHRALWTPMSSAAEQECESTLEICDDNNIDDDCDGAINEGCNCDTVDICNNGKDDDCDKNIDEDCKD